MERARSKTHERRGTIFSETKTIGNVTTVILPACLTHKSGHNSRRASKNCAMRLRAIPSYDRQPTLTIGSKKHRLRSPKLPPPTIIWKSSDRKRQSIGRPARLWAIFSNTRAFLLVAWTTAPTEWRTDSRISRQRTRFIGTGTLFERAHLRRLRSPAPDRFVDRFHFPIWCRRSARKKGARWKIAARSRSRARLWNQAERCCRAQRSLR